MYAWAVPASLAGDVQTDFNTPEENRLEKRELAYWRKFNHLHGWMERLYRTKGGKEDQFNCVSVRLMDEDLVTLLSEVMLNQLEPVSGFFFGGREIYPEDIKTTLEFIKEARQAIAVGNAVFYSSWW